MNTRHAVALASALVLGILAADPAAAQPVPPACPPAGLRVLRDRGTPTTYLGVSVPALPQLCHLQRGDGEGDFYLGVWRSDWPGAGLAYPVLYQVIHGGPGTRGDFVTRSYPGMQWNDWFVNEGIETVVVAGQPRPALRLAHGRQGIEGNTYHSIITSWLDLATGAALRTDENQIAGQSYGPNTTWHATGFETVKPGS